MSDARNKLTGPQRHLLNNFVEKRYVESRLNDTGFSILATKELGVQVTVANVVYSRTSVGIPNNFPMPERTRQPKQQEAKAPEAGDIASDLQAIEAKIDRILRHLNLPLI